MTWRCVYGEPFPEHADFATEVEAHEFALRVSREQSCEVAVIAIPGPERGAEATTGPSEGEGLTKDAKGAEIGAEGAK